MGEREDIGWNQPVRRRQPPFSIGGPVIRHDQIEIEHQPLKLTHAQTRAIKEHCPRGVRSEEHTSELQPLLRTSYAVFCLKKKNKDYPLCSTHNRPSAVEPLITPQDKMRRVHPCAPTTNTPPVIQPLITNN